MEDQKRTIQYEQLPNGNHRKLTENTIEYSTGIDLNDYALKFLKDSVVQQPIGIYQQKYMSYKQVTKEGEPNSNGVIQPADVFHIERIDHQKQSFYPIRNKNNHYYYDLVTDTDDNHSSMIETSSRIIGFDATTGQSLVSVSEISDNSQSLISRIVPAWWKYYDEDVGSDDLYDKNMLSQIFENKYYVAPISVDSIDLLKGYNYPNHDVIEKFSYYMASR